MSKTSKLSITVIILAALWLLSGIHIDSPAPRARTVSLLKNQKRAIWVVTNSVSASVGGAVLNQNRNSNRWQNAFLTILSNNVAALKIPSSTIGSFSTDGWGTPFNILVKEDDEPSATSGVLEEKWVGGIVIWSSGPNKSNEWGAGDDLIWP